MAAYGSRTGSPAGSGARIRSTRSATDRSRERCLTFRDGWSREVPEARAGSEPDPFAGFSWVGVRTPCRLVARNPGKKVHLVPTAGSGTTSPRRSNDLEAVQPTA